MRAYLSSCLCSSVMVKLAHQLTNIPLVLINRKLMHKMEETALTIVAIALIYTVILQQFNDITAPWYALYLCSVSIGYLPFLLLWPTTAVLHYLHTAHAQIIKPLDVHPETKTRIKSTLKTHLNTINMNAS